MNIIYSHAAQARTLATAIANLILLIFFFSLSSCFIRGGDRGILISNFNKTDTVILTFNSLGFESEENIRFVDVEYLNKTIAEIIPEWGTLSSNGKLKLTSSEDNILYKKIRMIESLFYFRYRIPAINVYQIDSSKTNEKLIEDKSMQTYTKEYLWFLESYISKNDTLDSKIKYANFTFKLCPNQKLLLTQKSKSENAEVLLFQYFCENVSLSIDNSIQKLTINEIDSILITKSTYESKNLKITSHQIN